MSNGDSDLFSEESSLLTPSDPALFGPFMTCGGEGQICPPDQIGLMSNFLMWPLFGPTMYILSCFAILALLFRISNLVLPRVRKSATAVLLNGVKHNESLFITRSSWLNCALRVDEAVYWVSIKHYEVAVGN